MKEKRLNRAYWMLADTELPIAKNLSYKSSFEAHFKHGLLFNEKLMISDAQAVNCVNFRTLINESTEFKQLISKDLLSIAVRDPLGTYNCDRLTQVRDAFQTEKKCNMEQQQFLLDADLDFVNESCEIIPYTYSSLRENYTENIFNIFNGENAKQVFGSDIQRMLIDRLLIESERDQGLGRIFLHKNFESDLRKIGKHDIWTKHRDDIIKFSDAPYVTGISKVLNTNPIYSPLHQSSFELAYPKKPQVIEKKSSIEIATNLNLSSYEQALSKLMPEDILFLRDSLEFKEYQKKINYGVSSENSLENTLDALIAYQNLIDQYIIKRHLGLKTSKQFKGKRYLQPMRKISQESGVFALGLALTDAVAGGALSIANFFVSEIIDRQSTMTEQKMIREKYKLQTTIENSADNDKIKAQHFSKDDVNETIYTSLDKF
ncbi:hypothetical protein NQT69_03415 [Pseudoalteromonas shioyasakiensis]|uniref:hypothetical protein n=1 Tax=Pseudoalteromonas shioyasakiensis TaxID=1190813 RepID=UPI00211974E7|nr:hypothetical protein [Pseudoalteromonas shioyasakiensis]MCQ8877087.1 hypothetical protein [Pseudoalteromonas shioyasakiensis]